MSALQQAPPKLGAQESVSSMTDRQQLRIANTSQLILKAKWCLTRTAAHISRCSKKNTTTTTTTTKATGSNGSAVSQASSWSVAFLRKELQSRWGTRQRRHLKRLRNRSLQRDAGLPGSLPLPHQPSSLPRVLSRLEQPDLKLVAGLEHLGYLGWAQALPLTLGGFRQWCCQWPHHEFPWSSREIWHFEFVPSTSQEPSQWLASASLEILLSHHHLFCYCWHPRVSWARGSSLAAQLPSWAPTWAKKNGKEPPWKCQLRPIKGLDLTYYMHRPHWKTTLTTLQEFCVITAGPSNIHVPSTN